MKSNENLSIYYVFERLGHHESANFPIKNHQKSCLQSKHAFWHPKSQKISKSDLKWSPMGDPKSIKNHWKSILAPSRVPLSASVPDLITEMVSKDLQMDSKWFPGDPKRTYKSTTSNNSCKSLSPKPLSHAHDTLPTKIQKHNVIYETWSMRLHLRFYSRDFFCESLCKHTCVHAQ